MSILCSKLVKSLKFVGLVGEAASFKNKFLNVKSWNVLSSAGYKDFPDPPKEKGDFFYLNLFSYLCFFEGLSLI